MHAHTAVMSRRRHAAALTVAALALALGIVLRWESARHEATGLASSCRISDAWDCDRVQASAWSKTLGVSMSVWGAAGYAVMLGWLLAARRRAPGLVPLAGLLAMLCLAASAFMAYVSWFEIGAFCLYCTGMQACALLLAVLVVPPAWRARGERIAGRPALLAGIFAGGTLLLAVTGDAYAARTAELARLLRGPEGNAVRIDISESLVLGDPDTPHTAVIFFDFGCPYCEQCYTKAKRLAQTYPDAIHFVFKHFPLDRSCNKKNVDATAHPGACRAARAGQVAALRGRDAFALEFLFSHQGEFNNLVLGELARKLGMKAAEWRTAVAAPRVTHLVRRDIEDGNALGLDHVPVAFVDGRPCDPNRLARCVERVVGSR